MREFLRLEAAGGFLLLGAAVLALILANTPLDWLYDGLLDTAVVVQIGALKLAKPLLLWINDGLMAVFFLLVGLEIKREVAEGELSSWTAPPCPQWPQSAALPCPRRSTSSSTPGAQRPSAAGPSRPPPTLPSPSAF